MTGSSCRGPAPDHVPRGQPKASIEVETKDGAVTSRSTTTSMITIAVTGDNVTIRQNTNLKIKGTARMRLGPRTETIKGAR